MAVQVAWGSDWVGQAAAVFPDLEAVRAALRCSLRRALRVLPPSWRGCLLKRAAGELEARMLTECPDALAEGKPWHASSGPVWISVLPWNGLGSPV